MKCKINFVPQVENNKKKIKLRSQNWDKQTINLTILVTMVNERN